jgi:DNA-binding transcriptional LysR family regulator
MARPRFRQFLRHGFLPQLMAFEACLRLGSVTRAAEELSLAQPTVSGLLRRLSETVGEPVLRASRGRMEPTDAGLEIAILCEEMFDALGRYEARRSSCRPAAENFAYAFASEIIRASTTRKPWSNVPEPLFPSK